MVEYVCRFFIVRVISYQLIIPTTERFGIHGLLLSEPLDLSVKPQRLHLLLGAKHGLVTLELIIGLRLVLVYATFSRERIRRGLRAS